ncbi:MAG TPA: isoprenylcysteine carboxylmethyltransferase family protein [Planctomycetaceae bacterium]|nr:isoprenylcysteine carboxylmethyltransferase family protein [Planctomycetaceae bacterium]
MRFLELKIPPPILVLLTVAIMLGLWYCRVCPLANPWAIQVAALFAVVGITFGLPSMLRFRKTGTIKPTHPEKATRLVVSGMYRFSRNPMYLGATSILLAIGIFLDDGLALLPVPLFAAYLNSFQIIPEERALEELFGDEYRDYKKRVRRWI